MNIFLDYFSLNRTLSVAAVDTNQPFTVGYKFDFATAQYP